MKLVDTVKKSISFLVTKDLLLNTENEIKLNLPRVDVTDKQQFWIEWFPNGDAEDSAGFISVFFCVNLPVKTVMTFYLGSSVSKQDTYIFPENGVYGFSKFATHQQIRDAFQNGKATVTCDVEFEVELPQTNSYSSFFNHKFFETADNLPHDCELVVGNKTIKAHKYLFALISPSLYANFLHDTTEAKTGKIYIKDFNYNIVKAAMDFLYGRHLVDFSMETVIGMLRFLDKYNIKASHLERIPYDNITFEDFFSIVIYAFDCCKSDLFDSCAKFFVDNAKMMKLQNGYDLCSTDFILKIITTAMPTASVFDLLHFTHNEDLLDVMKHIENMFTLTSENFCQAARFAWNFGRFDLKVRCAVYIKSHKDRDNMIASEEFANLGDIAEKMFKFAEVFTQY